MDSEFCTKTIAQVFDEVVEHHGDCVAYGFRRNTYTWGETDQAVRVVMENMRAAGIGAGTPVGICAPNSYGYLVTFFAIQRLGAVAVLMNRDDSLEEIAVCCRLAHVELLCFNGSYRQSGIHLFVPNFKPGEAGSLRAFMDISAGSEEQYVVKPFAGGASEALPSVSEAMSGASESAFQTAETVPGADEAASGASAALDMASDALREPDCRKDACILFTSGSSGKPKAVRLSHFSMLNTALFSGAQYHLESTDRLCLALPLFHCFGIVFCILSALCAHAPVFIASTLRTIDIVHVIVENRCTVFHAVPTLFLAIARKAQNAGESLSCIRASTLAGAALMPHQYERLSADFPHIHFMTAYGQTETSPTLTHTSYDDTFDHLCHTVGKPLKNVELVIAKCDIAGKGDDSAPWGNADHLCQTGEVGEILARGYCLMNGYASLSESEQPFDEYGWLHTGDLGFFDEEGYLHIAGRIKEIIIRGGENISPIEVEKEITAYGSVVMCKVLGVPHEFYGEEVVACLKLTNGSRFDEADLVSFLSGRLADYKIPTRFYLFDRFPMTPAGKPDIQLLRASIES